VSGPKGTYDVLPGAEFGALLPVREALLAPARLAGYAYVEPPVFEATDLFSRGVGESTDVVTKEMFTFADRADRSLTLRPEGTVGVLRAALDAGLHKGQLPVKLRYAGPMFRAERPQAGRYRQFQQVGIEALGLDDPALDAEVVALAWQAYAGLGLSGVRLLLTSLGDPACRPAYRQALADFLTSLDLDEDTRRRAELNPLRVLDDKRPAVQAQLADAPLMPDALCDPCREHLAAVQAGLDALGVPYEPAPRLVRGLDYYMRTTFEFVHDGLGAQSAAGGGGRYDGLSEAIGGPPLPGIGWAMGVERTILALRARASSRPPSRPSPSSSSRSARRQGARRRPGRPAARRRAGRRPRLRRPWHEGRHEGGRPVRRGLRRRAGRPRPGRRRGPAQGPARPRAVRRTARAPDRPPAGGAAVIRTHEAGTLREEHAGTTVTLTGWVARRRDHGGVAFLDLRDGSGIAQVVVRENDIAHDLRAEYCVRVVGEVRVRPEGNRNEALPTGAVEVAASEVEVLSASAPLPFPLDDDIAVGDEVRLKYRYLDLRRASSAAALRTRSLITRSIRRVMDERDFLDIETPTLTRSTPEGARDFLVPVRLQPGSWYALPQSPQLFKQLLMVAGMERYYQIARCYRDEDFRADRQPEFTQLDIEMSFPDEEDLYELTEAVMTRIWREVLGSRSRRRSRG
jgi:histidyl-tRNA synthetase